MSNTIFRESCYRYFFKRLEKNNTKYCNKKISSENGYSFFFKQSTIATNKAKVPGNVDLGSSLRYNDVYRANTIFISC